MATNIVGSSNNQPMNSNRRMTFMLCFTNIITLLTHEIKEALPDGYLDDDEIYNIVRDLIINNYKCILNVVFNQIETDTEETLHYGIDSYQENMDHLMFCGLDYTDANKITHNADNYVLRNIIETIPDIDDKHKYKILSMELKKTDFILTVEILHDQIRNNINRLGNNRV